MKPIKITADSKGRFPNVWITSDTHFGHKNICRGGIICFYIWYSFEKIFDEQILKLC
jgi:calcineurin-like phosphoesterase family protein